MHPDAAHEEIYKAIQRITSGHSHNSGARWSFGCSNSEDYAFYNKLIRDYPGAFAVFGITPHPDFKILFRYNNKVVSLGG